MDREGRQGGVAGSVVDRVESKDRDETGRARIFDPPAKAADLLGDPRQGAVDVDRRRREEPGTEEGEMATFPLGGGSPFGRWCGRRRRARHRYGMSQAVLVHARAQRVARDTERGGGATDVPAVGSEGGFDVAAQRMVHRSGHGRRARLCAIGGLRHEEVEHPGGDLIRDREQRHALQRVGQLTHVAGPAVRDEPRARIRRQATGRETVVGARARQEVVGELEDVATARAQRR